MLTSILYQLFLQPLETLYRLIFDLCQKAVSGNVLLALLLLSLISSLVLSAVERKAAKYVNKEKIIQGVLGKQLSKIKAEFHGVERQQKIKALYGRYSYNPLYSARSSLGVLSQLPFLLGAYLMLLHNDTLKGIAIWKFEDISEPDGLLFGLNLLPVLMLAVNALNSFLSTWLTRKEKLTALVIGLVFFVLLYAAPACMLIYWTTNNLIQLLKTLYKRVAAGIGAKDGALKRIFADVRVKVFYRTKSMLDIPALIKRVRNVFFDYPGASSLVSLVVLAGGWMLMRYGESISRYCHIKENVKDPNCTESLMLYLYDKPWFVQYFSCAFAAVLLFLLYVLLRKPVRNFLHEGKERYGVEEFVCRALAGAAAIIACGAFFVYHAINQTQGKLLLLLILAIIAITQFKNRRELMRTLKPDAVTLNKSKALYMPAVLVISGLIAVYAPTMLYLSDPGALGIGFKEFTVTNLQFLLVLWFASALCYYIATGAIRILMAAVAVVTAIVALVYALMLIPNLGAIQIFQFDRPKFLNAEVFDKQDLTIGLCAAIVCYLLYRFKKLRLISTVMMVFCAYIYIYPFTKYQQNAEGDISAGNHEVASSDAIPQNVKDFFTFSKQDNILVVAIDAFTGGNIRELIKMYPELKQDLDGFTWYEDTMTAGQGTDRGIQGCLGGEAVDPVRLQRDVGISTAERINRGWSELLNYLIDKGYQVNVHEPSYLRPNLITKYLKSGDNNYRFLGSPKWYGGFWNEMSQIDLYMKLFKKNEISTLATTSSDFIKWYGLYSILPNSQKAKVYTDGSWNNSVNLEDSEMITKTLQFSDSELLPVMSSVDAPKPQYKFIHLMTTHWPFNLDAKCNVSRKPFLKQNPDYTIDGHLNTEYCALKSMSRFFKWMKEQGIYDKSQIILVSDHSEHHVKPETDDTRLTAAGIGLTGPTKYFGNRNASYALLMVKERQARHDLKTDSVLLMRNLDTPLFIKHALGDELTYEPYKNKERIRINVQSKGYHPGSNPEEVNGAYVVRGSMFDKSHWTEVTDPDEVKDLWRLLYDKE